MNRTTILFVTALFIGVCCQPNAVGAKTPNNQTSKKFDALKTIASDNSQSENRRCLVVQKLLIIADESGQIPEAIRTLGEVAASSLSAKVRKKCVEQLGLYVQKIIDDDMRTQPQAIFSSFFNALKSLIFPQNRKKFPPDARLAAATALNKILETALSEGSKNGKTKRYKVLIEQFQSVFASCSCVIDQISKEIRNTENDEKLRTELLKLLLQFPVEKPKARSKKPASSKKAQVISFHAEFPKPAQIPIPGDEICCKTIAGRGFVIYEGMRVTAKENGQYRVSFLVEAPPVETLLRLQLVLFMKCKNKNKLPTSCGTVTLRPISIKPNAKKPFEPVRITQTGYSPCFKTACKCHKNIRVARVGTATFGSRPE